MKSGKINILILVDWFTPGFRAGGPIRSVSNVVKSFQNEFNFWILTSNKDLGMEMPYDLDSDVWLDCEGHSIYYSSVPPSKEMIQATIGDKSIHLVYFNSMFSPAYTIRPLRTIKNMEEGPRIVVAPRGMLSEQALAIKSAKKKLFLTVAKLAGWYSGLRWHSTSTEETKSIKKRFKDAEIIEAPNIGWLPDQKITAENKVENTIRLVSVSRIARIKNIDLIFKVLAKMPDSVSINYRHIGPIEDADYWQSCMKLANELAPNIEFEYVGEKSHEEISQFLLDAQLLIMLSASENFGHVILEAFSHGLPCVVSNGTPWRRLEDKKVGFDLSCEDIDGITEKLIYFCSMNAKEFGVWSEAARSFAEDCISNDVNLTYYKKVFSIE